MKAIARFLTLALLALPAHAYAGDNLGPMPVYAKTNTALPSQPVGADAATKANIQGNNTAPGVGGGMQVLSLDTESSAPTCTAGRFCMPWGDTAGRLHVVNDLALTMDITKIGGAAPSASNPLWLVLSDGAAAYTGVKTGQLPSALDGSGFLKTHEQGTVPVTQASPTGVIFGTSAATSLTGTSLVTPVCKSALAISTITKIESISVTSFNSARCICQYNDNGSKTVIANLATSPSDPTASMIFTSAKPNLTTSATATTQQVECACTGADANQAASDITCTVTGCQSNSGC